ncbi:hypothetical protein [Delftia tsuruhatensis]|uniref:hypothetical protein n=1 Tax=Delftia tsuruhatensis TaxID=180282 RepID=UPI002028FEAC|nr:hypothetical protein [Delftia tsuruhatensis]
MNQEIAEQRGTSARDRLLSAGRQYEGTQIAPAPQSQVEAALSQVDAGMQDLQNTIKRISGRLEPVLLVACVTAEGSAQKAEPAATPVPLVRRLNAMAAQLRQECAALQDLERRLAL